MSRIVEEIDHPLPPKETLPTMYDLPDEEVGQPGMPDIFHVWQPQLLEATFRPPKFTAEEIFVGTDLNLYYDVRHTSWNIRPDWFAVVGLPKEAEQDMRLSYVIWQEGIDPLIVVELLSPRTEKEDLGESLRDTAGKPAKWDVYEQKLRVPYYVTFSRYTDQLRVFKQSGARYQEVKDHQGRLWLEEVELGLGLWQGSYHNTNRLWLRWYDVQGNWIPTPEEKAKQAQSEKEQAQLEMEQERLAKESALQQLEQEHQRTEKMAELLRRLGQDPSQI